MNHPANPHSHNHKHNYNYHRNKHTLRPNHHEPSKPNINRASQQLKYHSPFQRLQKRVVFLQRLKDQFITDEAILKLDNFALFDAVIRRGGYKQATAKNKWEDISISLHYQKKFWSFSKHYQDHLLSIEEELKQACQWYSKESLLQQNQIEIHLLPSNNLTRSYYHLTTQEYLFADSNFFSLDEYFNIKTIIMIDPQIAKVPAAYTHKYIIASKWLYFSNQVHTLPPKLIRAVRIPESMEANKKIVIIGFSLASGLIADKLSDCGMSVVIVDKNRRQNRWKQDFLVENGVILLQGGKSFASYYNSLLQVSFLAIQSKVGLQELQSKQIVLLDEQGKPYSQQRIRVSEQHFIGIIDEVKSEVMNKKNLYEQIIAKLLRKKLDYQRFFIKWHYDRYMMFNRIKGDSTVVGDIIVYENKKFIKHISQNSNLIVLRSMEKLVTKLKEKKNVSIIESNIDQIIWTGSNWSINLKSQTICASHLIHSDPEAIYRTVLDGNIKLPQFSAETLGDSLAMMQQLTVMKYINCLYKFKQKVGLRQGLGSASCFSINCSLGFIYCFLLSGGTEILSILKCYHNSNMNYYAQILAILEAKCLNKNNKLINQEIYSFQYTFGIKDEKYMEAIIKLKPQEKLYMMLPITTTNCPHRIAAQIDLANYIAVNILIEAYPDYSSYDASIKQDFKQDACNFGAKQLQRKAQSVKRRSEKEQGQQMKGQVEELAKVRIITPVANGTLQLVSNDSQGQIASISAIHQINDDWFGLKHPIVKSYQSYLKARIQSNIKLTEALTHCSFFDLSSPISLYSNLELLEWGYPKIRQQQWFQLTGRCGLSVCLLNGMTTRREYISLEDSFRTTIYFQMILWINQQLYYCIIDQNCPSAVYYHIHLDILINLFNNKLASSRKEQLQEVPFSKKNYSHFKITRCHKTTYPPDHISASYINSLISEELSCIGDKLSLDDLLFCKLKQIDSLKVVRSKYMSPACESLISALSSELIKPNKPDIIYEQLATYLRIMLEIYELREFSLFQIFFGVLNEQYMGCEIMKKFTTNPLSFEQLEKMDESFGKQIQSIFSKNVLNEMNSLLIVPNEDSILIHRNFLSPSRKYSAQRYTFMLTISGTVHKQFLIQEGSQKIQFSNELDIMKQIIASLSTLYTQAELIHHWRNLINQQLQAEADLTPKIKLYYRMAKKLIAVSATNSPHKFTDRCKDLSTEQSQMLISLMKKRRIRWVQNDFIFVT